MAHRTNRTRQRRDVHRALLEAQGFVSAQALHFALRSNGTNIGLATVYRALHAFADSGKADTIHRAGTQLFRASAPDGQHYRLVCRDCQRRVPVDLTFVDAWAEAVAHEHGFTDARLAVEIAGRCGTCSPPTKRPPVTTGCCQRQACRC